VSDTHDRRARAATRVRPWAFNVASFGMSRAAWAELPPAAKAARNRDLLPSSKSHCQFAERPKGPLLSSTSKGRPPARRASVAGAAHPLVAGGPGRDQGCPEAGGTWRRRARSASWSRWALAGLLAACPWRGAGGPSAAGGRPRRSGPRLPGAAPWGFEPERPDDA
jgi:hypothetical protein